MRGPNETGTKKILRGLNSLEGDQTTVYNYPAPLREIEGANPYIAPVRGLRRAEGG